MVFPNIPHDGPVTTGTSLPNDLDAFLPIEKTLAIGPDPAIRPAARLFPCKRVRLIVPALVRSSSMSEIV
jgi:hypothetical protein